MNNWLTGLFMGHGPLLSALIWLPVLGAGLILLTCSSRDETAVSARRARLLALATVILTVFLCWPLVSHFDTGTAVMQFREQLTWLPAWGLNYDLGVDGISMPLVVLTVFTNAIIIGSSWRLISDKVAQYLAAFLVMQGMVVGIFSALDGILFYLFWEAVLIPMYLCIGVWGGANRSYAAMKFFLYTFFGSALMLAALIYLGLHAQSFSILSWMPLKLGLQAQIWMFIAFFLAFAIKVPMWPVHTWLPDAHTEAPTGGSVLLAALMLKLGAYGFLRLSLPILPDAASQLSIVMIVLSLIAVVYVGLVALAQTDMKRLIAYSSVAHMGFVTLGLFVIGMIVAKTGHQADGVMAVEGAMVQMISHAFSSGAMFLAFGLLYERMHTRLISDFGGVATSMPIFTAFFVVFCLANVGLPGTSGFVGELMVILSAAKANLGIAAVAALTLVISASYTLSMVKRVFYGPINHEAVNGLKDADTFERGLLAIMALMIFALGLYPEPLLKLMHASIHQLLGFVMISKLPGISEPSIMHTLRPAFHHLPSLPSVGLKGLMPEMCLSAGVSVLLLLSTMKSSRTGRIVGVGAGLVILMTMVLTWMGWGHPTMAHVTGPYLIDAFAVKLKLFMQGTVLVCLIYADRYLHTFKMQRSEFYVLALLSLLGMMVMVSAGDLLLLFIGLELMSLPLYAMVCLRRDEGVCSEAAMKYFVMGALASALLLYGFSFLYGSTGSIEWQGIAKATHDAFGAGLDPNLAFALVFILVGLAFKLGLAPFHMWVPDVYEGAPTPVTMLIASAPKLAVFAALIRILTMAIPGALPDAWVLIVTIMAVLSVVIGHLCALRQHTVKRLLAYSSIAHMGYVMFAVILATQVGYDVALFYLLAYMVMTVAGFAIPTLMSHQDEEILACSDLAGLNASRPGMAALMLICLFSMAGVPPMLGFMAKLAVLKALLTSDHLGYVVLILVLAVVGAAYYIRFVKQMYFDAPKGQRLLPVKGARFAHGVLVVNGLALVALGLFPYSLMSAH